MQFGVFSVGDVTQDPTTGRTPTEAERIKAMVAVAEKTEEVGLDVFATGEHHNPPFVPSSPTTIEALVNSGTSSANSAKLRRDAERNPALPVSLSLSLSPISPPQYLCAGWAPYRTSAPIQNVCASPPLMNCASS